MKKGVIFTIIALLVLTSLFATDKTLNFFKTNRQVLRFALSTIDSVKTNNSTNQILIHKKDGTKSTVSMTEIDSMNYTSGEYLLPTVQSLSLSLMITIWEKRSVLQIFPTMAAVISWTGAFAGPRNTTLLF